MYEISDLLPICNFEITENVILYQLYNIVCISFSKVYKDV